MAYMHWCLYVLFSITHIKQIHKSSSSNESIVLFFREPILSSLLLIGMLGLRKPPLSLNTLARGIFRLLLPKITFSSLNSISIYLITLSSSLILGSFWIPRTHPTHLVLVYVFEWLKSFSHPRRNEELTQPTN